MISPFSERKMLQIRTVLAFFRWMSAYHQLKNGLLNRAAINVLLNQQTKENNHILHITASQVRKFSKK